jgi:hypothetical protein
MCTEIAKLSGLDNDSDMDVTKYELRTAAPRILGHGQPSGVRYMWSCTVSSRHPLHGGCKHVSRSYSESVLSGDCSVG